MMNEKYYELWNNLAFKSTTYGRNFDFVHKNENFITEYDGVISETRMNKRKPPFQAGEYQFSAWNFGLAREFNVDLSDNLYEYYYDDMYDELAKMADDNYISFNKIDKLFLLNTLIIHPDYRKMDVTEEFIESMYRNFIYGGNNLMIALVKPIQENTVDYEFFWKSRTLQIKQLIGRDTPYEEIPAKKYYNLDKLIENDDNEINEYKLFNVAVRCGFERIGESHLFKFKPTKTIEKKKKKRKLNKNIAV